VQVAIDDHGILRNPDVHDVNLCGLRLLRNTLNLYFVDPRDDSTFSVTIPNIVDCRMEGFKEGNIVFELKFLQPSLLDIDSQMQHYRTPERTEEFEEARKTMAHQATEQHLTFIQIDTSYGCDLIAISSSSSTDVKWEQHHMTKTPACVVS